MEVMKDMQTNTEIQPQTPSDMLVQALNAKARRGQRGMTLVEIMVVIGIIGTITVVLATGVLGSSEEADINAAGLLIDKVGQQLEATYARSTPREFPENLNVLVEKGLLTADQVNDPWGTPLSYSANGRTYELCSGGPDKSVGGSDDICKKNTNRR